ncbi:MAG: cob(I)yrinic acid a,c-diamide adenosyltransferase [Candidatus Thermoplasmatota archaeon]
MDDEKGQGLIQVYTGDGKGKTTAAIGLAIRAAGRGLNIYIGQFMKGSEYGEQIALGRFDERITLEQYGEEGLHVTDSPSEKEIRMAKDGLRKVKEALDSGEFDVVIADEICVAHHFDLLSLDDLIDLEEGKPEDVELILTGRKAPEEVIDLASLVTEMKEIKHPYQEGIEAREGIEF